MSDLDLARLREVAEAATPGPWEADVSPYALPSVSAPAGWVGDSEHISDAQHIATFDPPTVLALLDRLAEQEFHIQQLTESRDRAERAAEKAEAAVAVVRSYFDLSEDPWEDHEAACPAPEDLWRLHRDLRAALDGEGE